MLMNHIKRLGRQIVGFFGLIGACIALLVAIVFINGLLNSGLEKERAERLARERFVYDPGKCSTDAKGMMYFAYGDRHFHLSSKSVELINWIMTKDTIKKTGSTEQMGCPLNPVRDYKAIIEIAWPLSTPMGVKEVRPQEYQKITFILEPFEKEDIEKAFLENQMSNEAVFKLACIQHDKIRTYKNGLVECQMPGMHPKGQRLYGTFRAERNKYSTPLGYNFTLESRLVNGDTSFSARYPLTENVILDYGFSETVTLPENIIPLDIAIRRKAFDILNGKETLE